MSENNQQIKLLNTVLSITRDQLSQALAKCAELEAFLVLENQKSADLEAKLASLEKKDPKSND